MNYTEQELNGTGGERKAWIRSPLPWNFGKIRGEAAGRAMVVFLPDRF